MKIFRPEFKQTEVEMQLLLPQETFCYFQARKSYRLTPRWTTWNVKNFNKPERIYAYDVTIVSNEWGASIKRFDLNISEQIFQEFLKNKGARHTFTETEEILHKLIWFPKDDERTKEQFEQDFNTALKNLKHKIS